MNCSHYIKVYPYEETPGQLLVYSTKKASIALIPETIFASIQNNTLSPEEAEALGKLGIIEPDREDEKREMRHVLDRLNAKNKGLTISVIINMACNFECVYCYEGSLKGGHYMSEKTAGLLIDFIKERFTGDKDLLHLDFYGGEPLLSISLIREISETLTSFTAQRGAKYTFSLVSNGSLFSRKAAEELVPVGLDAVRITLDGDAETHNRYRPYRTGKGSFDTIIENIRETCGLVKMGIGGNYDRGTYERFPLLLDYLEKEGLTPDRIYEIKFGPVSKRPEEDSSPADYTDWCLSVNEPWVLKAGMMLREEILKRGYNTPKIMPMPCQVEINDSYVVNYDGGIYKCPALVGRKGFEAGNLADGNPAHAQAGCGDPYKADFWKNATCLACEYLPLCFGGCRYMAFVRNGNIDSPDCRRPFFDAALETFIKQDIKYRKPARPS